MSEKQINKQIHEKVFGKCWFEGKLGAGDAVCGKCDGFRSEHSLPDYSVYYVDAFEVVAEMERRGFVWTFSNNGNESAPKYDARFFILNRKWGAPDFTGIAIKETLAEAICEAALNAIEQL